MNKTTESKSYAISDLSLTQEQRLVVDTMGKNLLVSASAGSGKTMVMIRRIVEMIISKKASVSDMLVVTFTKAAAAEMKQKLIDALNKIEPKTDFIRSELLEVNVANISTLHSFCARLLKTYFYEIGLDPSFVLIDEVESASLKDKAIEKLIYDNFLAGNKEFFDLLDIFSLKRSDENFKQVIYKLSDYFTTQVDLNTWINSTISGAFEKDLNENVCAKYIDKFVLIKAQKDLVKINNMLSHCTQLGVKELIAYLNEYKSQLDGLKQNNGFIKNRNFLLNYEFNTRLPKVADEFADLKEDCKILKDNINKDIEKFKSLYGKDDIQQLNEKMDEVKRRVVALLNLTQNFNSLYSDLKKEKIALDFSDLEKYTIQLLNNKDIRKTIQDRFKYVFVDEYQDINMVQEEILKSVSSNNNLFMVGDIKQSIYRFRASEPQIFIDKYNQYSDRNSSDNLAINLNHNFRSHQDILAFVNEVFRLTMTKEFGNLDYEKDAMLQKGDKDYPNINEFPTIKMVTIVSPEVKKEVVDDALPVYSVKEHKNKETDLVKNAIAEGKAVVETIKKLFNTEIYIAGKNPIIKRVEYGDFSILTAQRNEYLMHILNELEAEEIPYSTDIATDIFEEPILNVLKSFLQVIENKNQDIPLLSIMQSQLFNFSVDELAEIRKHDRESKFFYLAVKNACKNTDLAQKLRKKCNFLFDTINDFSKKSKIYAVDQIISEIIKSFDFNYIVANGENGAKALINLNKLLASLSGKSYNVNLSKFLDFINNNPIKFEVESTENSVKVTTIHKSKGLQYPIVILIGCGRDLLITRGVDLAISKNMGVAINNYDVEEKTKSPSLIKTACSLEKRRLEIEEKSRLLYVALTRAINHLVLIGVTKEKELNKNIDACEAKCFFDWLLPVLDNKKNKTLINNNIKFEAEVRSLNSYHVIKEDLRKRNIAFGKTDEKVSVKTEKVFDYKYPYLALTDMPTKTTVTEILHTDDNIEKVAQVFNFGSNNGALIGTAYHKFLQNLDFKRSEENFEKEYLRVKNSVMSDEESKLIKKIDIQKFVDNKFTQQLAASLLKKEREFIALTKVEIKGRKTEDKDGIIVQGIVDLIAETDEGLIVVDYKTNKWKNEQQFIDVYAKQIDIYAKVIEESYQKKIIGKYIYSFSLQKYIKIN